MDNYARGNNNNENKRKEEFIYLLFIMKLKWYKFITN